MDKSGLLELLSLSGRQKVEGRWVSSGGESKVPAPFGRKSWAQAKQFNEERFEQRFPSKAKKDCRMQVALRGHDLSAGKASSASGAAVAEKKPRQRRFSPLRLYEEHLVSEHGPRLGKALARGTTSTYKGDE